MPQFGNHGRLSGGYILIVWYIFRYDLGPMHWNFQHFSKAGKLSDKTEELFMTFNFVGFPGSHWSVNLRLT